MNVLQNISLCDSLSQTDQSVNSFVYIEFDFFNLMDACSIILLYLGSSLCLSKY